MLIRLGIGLLLVLAAMRPLHAADMGEAQALYDEAMVTIRNESAPTKEYAMAMFKLDKAMEVIEQNGKTDTELAQEVAAARFWAGKRSDIHILNELARLRKIGKLPPRPKRTPRVADATEEGAGLAGLEGGSAAAEAYAKAESYADSHKEDDFKVALCWFQMAGEHPGTVYSLKAVEKARQAQDRFLAKQARQKEELPDTPEMAHVRDADKLVEAGELEKAIMKYSQSLRMKNTVVAQRRLGHTYFLRAQQIKDEILPQWKELQPKYVQAWKDAWIVRSGMRQFRNDYGPYVVARKQFVKLKDQLDRAFSYYQKGRWSFESVLKQSPERKDLDAAAHVALCFVAIPKERRQAKTKLSSFLRAYKPKNDAERMLYAYCQIELENIQAKK